MFGVLVAVLHLDRVARQAGLACPRNISRILLSRIARAILLPTCFLRPVPSSWIWIHFITLSLVRRIASLSVNAINTQGSWSVAG